VQRERVSLTHVPTLIIQGYEGSGMSKTSRIPDRTPVFALQSDFSKSRVCIIVEFGMTFVLRALT